jgi:PEP-CTERM motif
MKMNANFSISNLAIILATTASITTASATDVSVQSTMSIWNYGGTDITTAPKPITGSIPTITSITPGSGQVLTFSSVTGIVNLTDSGPNFYGPDGGQSNPPGAAPFNVTPFAGLSGIISGTSALGRGGYLAAVFLNGHENDPGHIAPATLTFTSFNFSSLSPLDDQVFFIGDGLTGTGTGAQQTFIVPADATGLVLGIVDAGGYNGPPGAYGDNSGSFDAIFSINSISSAVPEPSSWAMMILGFVGIGAMTYRRRKSAMLAA